LKDFSDICITGVSPSKSFNIAGLATAVVIVSNAEIRNKFNELNTKLHLYMGNTFGIRALIAAYNESEGWLEELLCYLNKSRIYITEFVHNELSKVILSPIEGTFLAWLDFRNWDLPDAELQEIMINKAGLALEPGTEFGKDGEGFMRLNFGCPQSILKLALKRLQILAKEYE